MASDRLTDLHNNLLKSVGVRPLDVVKKHPEAFKALQKRAFLDQGIQIEPIYGEEGPIAHEALARVSDGNGRPLSIQKISSQFYSLGAAKEFDAVTTENNLNGAGVFPLTVNISVEAALSHNFWESIKGPLERYAPEELIFEILEHDIDLGADISRLIKMREQGYSFALDDYDVPEDKAERKGHEKRWQFLVEETGLVEYLKLEGTFVRRGLERGDEIFYETVDTLANKNRDIILIAEHVQNADEVQMLHNLGISGFQGTDLTDEEVAIAFKTNIYDPEALDFNS